MIPSQVVVTPVEPTIGILLLLKLDNILANDYYSLYIYIYVLCKLHTELLL